ncbi:30S ribosomal protein S10 [Patescibacteria group bacterium]|nr:30S ribosomal protein S10 [Patescibacteria group bacterium]
MTPAKKKATTTKKSAPKKALQKGSGQAPTKKTTKDSSKKSVRQSSPLRSASKGQAGQKAKTAAEIAKTVNDTSTKKDTKKVEQPISSIRIRLSAFDHVVLDEATSKIIDTAERSGAVIHGPVPLPTKIRKFTVNKSTFVHKNARDQYEMRTHRRLIDLTETTFKTIDSLQNLSLPSGVDIEIKMG